MIFKRHKQRYNKKLFFSMDSIEFKVQIVLFAVIAIKKGKWPCRLRDRVLNTMINMENKPLPMKLFLRTLDVTDVYG